MQAVKSIPEVQLQGEVLWLQDVEIKAGGMDSCFGSVWDAIPLLGSKELCHGLHDPVSSTFSYQASKGTANSISPDSAVLLL